MFYSSLLTQNELYASKNLVQKATIYLIIDRARERKSKHQDSNRIIMVITK